MATQTPNIRIIRPNTGFSFNFPKLGPAIIILGMIILAGTAIGSAIYLYINRNRAIAPTAPTRSFAATTTSISDDFNGHQSGQTRLDSGKWSWTQTGTEDVYLSDDGFGNSFFVLAQVSNTGTSRRIARAYTPVDTTLVGDFSAEIDILLATGADRAIGGFAFSSTTSVQDAQVKIERYDPPSSTQSSLVATIGSQQGAVINLPGTSTTPVRVKIMRVGNIMQAFYSTDAGQNYILMLSDTNAYTGTGYLMFYALSDAPGYAPTTAKFDNFAAQVNLSGVTNPGAGPACTAYINGTLTDVKSKIGTWGGTDFPTDHVDAFAQYVQPNGWLRSNAFRGGQYWGYICTTFNAGVGTYENCSPNPTQVKTLGDVAAIDTTGIWQGTFPTTGVDAFAQYVQPNGVLRSNVFKDGTMWPYECTFKSDGNTIDSCTPKPRKTLAEVVNSMQWTPAFPTSIDAVSQYVQGTNLRTNVFSGNRYWAYDCTFDVNGVAGNCHAVTTLTLAELAANVSTTNGKWTTPFPTDHVDAFAQYVQPDGSLRSNGFRNAMLWGYVCQNANCSVSFTVLGPAATPGVTPTATPPVIPTLTPTPTLPPGTTPTVTLTPTPTPTIPGQPTPTPTTVVALSCGSSCNSDLNCPAGMSCYQGFCRNAQCPSAENCICGLVSYPTPTTSIIYYTGGPTPTPIVLTQAGSVTGTWLLTIGGIFLLASGGILLLGL